MLTQEQREEIVRLWNTTQYTARHLAGEFGVSRNVVIGIVGRARAQGLVTRPAFLNKHKKRRRPAALKVMDKGSPSPKLTGNKAVDKVIKRKWKKHPEYIHVVPNPVCNNSSSGKRWIPILECEFGTCRWSDDGKSFCNAPGSLQNNSWCNDHYPVVYRPNTPFNKSARHLREKR